MRSINEAIIYLALPLLAGSSDTLTDKRQFDLAPDRACRQRLSPTAGRRSLKAFANQLIERTAI